MIDSHCHLDFDEFDGRRDETIMAALQAGIHTMINIGTDLGTSLRSVELAEQFDCIYATVGVHPHDAKTYDKNVADRLLALTDNSRVKAVGEIGLDYYRDLSPRDAQQRVFRAQLEVAVAKKLPVVIHTRGSFAETVGIVREYSSRLTGGIFHCFPGTVREALDVIDLGFHVSVGGVITFPRAKMADVAASVPLESLLLETDCPYLAPVPYRGRTNQPAYVKYVRDKVAALRKIPATEVERITDHSCRKVYQLVDVFEG
ncbi:MAG: TatD family hydrolase [Candidatus Zixiibacteriota bacterium]|nr:MAG: TatD family hydrolase [candidate division Zixibacteria bacterium]